MTARADIRAFFDAASHTVSYVVTDPATRHCAVIDPVLDYDPKSGRTGHSSADAILDHIRAGNLVLDWILETHAHADHLSAAPYLQGQCGGRIAIGEHISAVQKTFKGIFNAEAEFRTDGSQFDHLFADGESFMIGTLAAQALHTPGHTPACLTYVIGDAAFVGDTLFMPDYGTARTDFPGGDAHMLYRSIQKLFALPESTRLFMCHDYGAPGRDTFAWQTTVGEQRASNVHIRAGTSEEDFVALRKARDAALEMPVLLLPSVQANMRAGRFPPPEANGISYFKIPINAL